MITSELDGFASASGTDAGAAIKWMQSGGWRDLEGNCAEAELSGAWGDLDA